MSKSDLAKKVVETMLSRDEFSRWLGIKLLEVSPGRARVSMTVRQEMLNGFFVCHGGIAFSLADSAFAFASNTHGRVAVSIESGMAYPAPIREGDEIIAEAVEQSLRENIGVYEVHVRKTDSTLVGVFRGTVYRTKKEIFEKTNETSLPN